MKQLLILILFEFLSISVYPQHDPKFILKLSGSAVVNARIFNYPYINEHYPGGSWVDKKNVPHFRIETCYLINKELELGLYFGISELTVSINPDDIYNTTSVTTNGYFYGGEINYHLTPLFVKRPIRFDIYGTAKTGMISKRWRGYDDQIIYTDNVFEVGVGIGSAFYFTRNFGLFGEVLGGKFYYSNINWKGGLIFCL